jgi:hypothetical protein
MKTWMMRVYPPLLVCLVAWQYAQWTWQRDDRYAMLIALSLEERPFVLRALIPWLARGLMKLGLAASTALNVLVMLSALGLFYGLDFLKKSLRRH